MTDPGAEIPHQGADPTPSMACSLTPNDPMSKLLDDDKTSSWGALAPVPPLEDENLLQEILIRLPPKPSSIPRASLVCARWHSILSDPEFLKRYRKHHRKPPVLGFFARKALTRHPVFTAVLESPDCIPSTRFSVPESCHSAEIWMFNGCRHGLAVLVHLQLREIVVWDPLSGRQHHVTFPQGLDNEQLEFIQVAVFCADAEDGHVHGDCFLSPFNLVWICIGYNQLFGVVYDSVSGVWGNVVSMATTHSTFVIRPSILVSNALFWSTNGGDILMYDIEKQTLGMIEEPVDSHVTNYWCFHLLRMAGGGLGLAVLSELTVQLWERKSDFDGVVRWVLLEKTIPLEEMLPWQLHSANKTIHFVGYDDDTNVIVLSTTIGKFMLQLDSMETRHIIERGNKCEGAFYPYANFYATGRRAEWKWLDLEP